MLSADVIVQLSSLVMLLLSSISKRYVWLMNRLNVVLRPDAHRFDVSVFGYDAPVTS